MCSEGEPAYVFLCKFIVFSRKLKRSLHWQVDSPVFAGESTEKRRWSRPRTVDIGRPSPRTASGGAPDDTAKKISTTPFSASKCPEAGPEVLQREDSAHVDEFHVDPVQVSDTACAYS